MSITHGPGAQTISNWKGAPPQSAPRPQELQLPKLEDLFTGSKPHFGKPYDKYIAAEQVPHPEPAPSYYDASKDAARAREYYGDLARLPDGSERIGKLRDLVTSTHKPEPRGYHYVVAKHLYSEVDRHPDGTIRSVYTREPIQVLTYPDLSLQTLAENDLSAIAGASASAPEVIGAWLAFQKGAATMNCEHVVPQSYFDEREPMRSDLHHLFACDIKENSRRGDTPYGSFTPQGGKGEVARATLYFMLRYPEIRLPYQGDAIRILKEWSAQDPPDAHERHRNAEIQTIQGNRNPFVDHPEWVADFQP